MPTVVRDCKNYFLRIVTQQVIVNIRELPAPERRAAFARAKLELLRGLGRGGLERLGPDEDEFAPRVGIELDGRVVATG